MNRPSLTALLAVGVALAVSGYGASRGPLPTSGSSREVIAAGAVGFPATFVAVSSEARAPGVTVYSSSTGLPQRRLTAGAGDQGPMLAHGGWVYFVRPPHAFGCSMQLWRVRLTGGAATRIGAAGYPGGPVAISSDRSALAYTVGRPGRCNLKAGADGVMVIDLRTGRSHRIEGDAAGLAWAPDGKTLGVETTIPNSGREGIRIISDPFSASTVEAAALLPCPTRDGCEQESPSFDAKGRLFYVATISTHAGGYCWLYACSDFTDAVVAASGTRAIELTSAPVRRCSGTHSAAVNASGTAVIYTLPQRDCYQRVWRWFGGTATRIAPPGANSTQPVWR